MSQDSQLRRSISLPMLVFYGVGTMVGGGFYALIGKVGGLAGMQMPLAFVVSAALALFTALTFSELASRFPYSGGTARYVSEIFGKPWLSRATGVAIVFTGIISAATLSRAMVGFVQEFVAVPTVIGLALIAGILFLIAVWGIGEAVTIAVLITVLEVGGLIYVGFVGRGGYAAIPERGMELLPQTTAELGGIVLGAFLAFYAYVGFEDMVTTAEEVKDPRRNVPRAILLSVLITTMLYVVVALAAILTVQPQVLSTAPNPLVEVLRQHGIAWVQPLVTISVLSGANGALVQVVMGSRVLYGLADQGDAPAWLARISATTQTPWAATMVVCCVIFVLAWIFPLVPLARATSFLLLIVFVEINIALAVHKLRDNPARAAVCYPVWVPLLGALLSLGAIATEVGRLATR